MSFYLFINYASSTGIGNIKHTVGLTARISRTVYRYFWAYPFLLSRFFFFPHFLFAGSVQRIKMIYVSFWAHVKIASRILEDRRKTARLKSINSWLLKTFLNLRYTQQCCETVSLFSHVIWSSWLIIVKKTLQFKTSCKDDCGWSHN